MKFCLLNYQSIVLYNGKTIIEYSYNLNRINIIFALHFKTMYL